MAKGMRTKLIFIPKAKKDKQDTNAQRAGFYYCYSCGLRFRLLEAMIAHGRNYHPVFKPGRRDYVPPAVTDGGSRPYKRPRTDGSFSISQTNAIRERLDKLNLYGSKRKAKRQQLLQEMKEK